MKICYSVFSHSQNLEGGFNCDCVEGYTGDKCELDVDECLDIPCGEDAICTVYLTHSLAI